MDEVGGSLIFRVGWSFLILVFFFFLGWLAVRFVEWRFFWRVSRISGGEGRELLLLLLLALWQSWMVGWALGYVEYLGYFGR